MRYLGGKSKIAQHLAEAMLKETVGFPEGATTYWEPFLGGGAVASKMGHRFDFAHYSDIQPDLVLMWQALQAGWLPPQTVSYDEYQSLRYSDRPSALRGFVGFGGSFGGRFFEGYAKGGYNSDGSPRNHIAESARAVLKDLKGMQAKRKTTFAEMDAWDISPKYGDVVYCDPPYAGTKGFSQTLPMDHSKFWTLAESWASSGVSVFVSEYEAPQGWSCIWERSKRSSVRVGSEDRHMTIERLFTIEGTTHA